MNHKLLPLPVMVQIFVLGLVCIQGPTHAQVLPPPTIIGPAAVDRGESLRTLQSLVALALDRAPAIREAQANLRAADQDVAQARGALWPRLEFNANTRAATLESNAINPVTARLGASLSYTLHDFGRVRSQIETRQFQALSVRDKLLLARETAVFETVSAYLQLAKYRRLTAVYEQHIADLRALVEKLAEIVAVIPGRRSELTQAQSRQGQAQDTLASIRVRQREFELALLRLTGTVASDLAQTQLPMFARANLDRMIQEAIHSHPAVRSARAEASAARAQAAEVTASQMPQTDIMLSKQAGRDANGFASPAQIYVTAKWLAFDGLSSRANAKAQEDRAQAAEARAAEYLQEIEFNIRSADSDYESQTGRFRDLEKLVRGTDQVRKDTYDLWRELGRRSLLDVLTAESEHLNTRVSLASSEVDSVLALARMWHEAGALKEWLVGDDGRTMPAEVIQEKRSGQVAQVDPPPVVRPVEPIALRSSASQYPFMQTVAFRPAPEASPRADSENSAPAVVAMQSAPAVVMAPMGAPAIAPSGAGSMPSFSVPAARY